MGRMCLILFCNFEGYKHRGLLKKYIATAMVICSNCAHCFISLNLWLLTHIERYMGLETIKSIPMTSWLPFLRKWGCQTQTCSGVVPAWHVAHGTEPTFWGLCLPPHIPPVIKSCSRQCFLPRWPHKRINTFLYAFIWHGVNFQQDVYGPSKPQLLFPVNIK